MKLRPWVFNDDEVLAIRVSMCRPLRDTFSSKDVDYGWFIFRRPPNTSEWHRNSVDSHTTFIVLAPLNTSKYFFYVIFLKVWPTTEWFQKFTVNLKNINFWNFLQPIFGPCRQFICLFSWNGKDIQLFNREISFHLLPILDNVVHLIELSFYHNEFIHALIASNIFTNLITRLCWLN